MNLTAEGVIVPSLALRASLLLVLAVSPLGLAADKGEGARKHVEGVDTSDKK